MRFYPSVGGWTIVHVGEPDGSTEAAKRCTKAIRTVGPTLIKGMLHHYKGKWPKLGERVYIAEGAQIIGDVEIGDHSSIWYNSVIRGDVYYVRIGRHTNIQDGCIGHVQKDQCALILKDYVTVGHGVMMHGCTIESHCLIGMRATILNDVVVGEHSIVGAGALITERTIIPPRSLVLGFPAKVKRSLTDEEVARIDEYAGRYYQYKETYLTMEAAEREHR